MLGTLRLLLALAVAASHAGLKVGGLNPGVAAVIGFYLISGYVMAGLIRRHYSQSAQAPAFYLDRAVRLLPQYLLYSGLTLAWHWHSQVNMPFLTRSPETGDLLNNLAVIPLNYYMFNGSDTYTLVPPAWSLGAEIQFYLVAPFLLVWPNRLLTVGVISFCVYAAALSGFINSDWYGYRLLPGVLLFFVLGAWLQKQHQQHEYAQSRATTAIAAVLAVTVLGLFYTNGASGQPYKTETLIGLILGIISLQALAARPPNRWDTKAGDISYGVFLNHFFIMWTLYPQGISVTQLPGFLALCMVFSWLTQIAIEQPLLKLRHRFRKSPQTLLN